MTKKEYMKKLAYQLRRLPKEDFDKAMDYFEEYFEDAASKTSKKPSRTWALRKKRLPH